ncbi:hypothetical protein [Serratia quinivorans]|uniref:hypothetical protein n=1 Tax=Serratia quinivorans TaxID=137545 RepID=UPI003982A677
MDNKLSELSKPYGYEYVTAGRGHVVMSRTLPPVDMREVKPLYSQEYVSALLQDISTLEQVLRHIHGAALDITVPRAAIAKAAEYATKKENRNG